jgi:anaphase-promoting complex subunit 3
LAPAPVLAAQEHETALRYFQRALQLDPGHAYAYTLAGHEYCAAEDFDRAKTCFESALRLNRRHYNAWCAGHPTG